MSLKKFNFFEGHIICPIEKHCFEIIANCDNNPKKDLTQNINCDILRGTNSNYL